MDPALVSRLRFEPELPARHRVLCGRTRMGTGIRVHVGCSRSFWRDAGLCGQAMSDASLVRLTLDLSPDDGSAGILVGFIGMPSADPDLRFGTAPRGGAAPSWSRSRAGSARRLGSRRIP